MTVSALVNPLSENHSCSETTSIRLFEQLSYKLNNIEILYLNVHFNKYFFKTSKFLIVKESYFFSGKLFIIFDACLILIDVGG